MYDIRSKFKKTGELTNDFSGSDNKADTKSGDFNLKNISGIIIYFVAFLLPGFFLPITYDEVSLNKTYLVVFGSLLSLVSLFLHGVVKKKLPIKSVDAYWGLGVFLLSVILGSIYTTNRHIAIYGSITKYEFSLIFWASISVLGFVVANSRMNLKKFILSFSSGLALISILSIIVFLGIKPFGINNAGPGFNLVGTILSYELATLVGSFSLLFLLTTKQINGLFKNILFGFAWFVISLAGLMLGDPLYIVSFVVLSVIVFVNSYRLNDNFSYVKKNVLPLFVSLIVCAFVILLPQTKESLNIAEMQISPNLTFSQSWEVTASVLKTNPLFGTGLGSFAEQAARYKPISLNSGDYWNLRFNRPVSDLFLWIVSGGVFGMILYLAFWTLLIKKALKLDSSKENSLLKALILILFVFSLVVGLNAVLWFFTMVIVGFVIMTHKKSYVLDTTFVNWTALAISLVMLGFVGFRAFYLYAGSYYFREAVLSADYKDRYTSELKAISVDPSEGLYRNSNVNTAMTMAIILSKDEKNSEAVSSLVQSAVLGSRILTEAVDPANSSYWETRTFVYGKLMDTVKEAKSLAVESASNAVTLDPNNPRLWINLGNVYYAAGDKNSAVKSFVQAVSLKNDYANAHYNLGTVLAELGAYDDALVQLQITARLVVDENDLSSVNKSIETVKEAISKKSKTTETVATQVPGIETDETSIEATNTTEQESLSEPGVNADKQEILDTVEVEKSVLDSTDTTETDKQQNSTTEEAPLAQPSVN